MLDSSEQTTFDNDWTAYYQAVAGRPPRGTLLKALNLFELEKSPKSPLFAVDLGCGDGRDTVELLERGWQVLAIDGNEEAIAMLRDRKDIDSTLLETQVMSFENLTIPNSQDLINSSFALPFCHPDDFPNLWNKIIASLRVGGRFCGQLFGDRDTWATTYTNMTHYPKPQVEQLLQSFKVEFFEEEEHHGVTAMGEQKYWHIFHIVASKK
ncbi:class I SAM-dependent methyltransferase [Pseudanabaena sp. FACHB-1998]|uniref:class I SAM-dependent methyltransferase n=1 Tax=Pseudanabaena sp. FACHB-1998 TaxID=2692858 RepID=UPI00168158E2|nr:class I SAM-dependent methyltransferase [Pseudanabaena sp. FACHB-1998]MBD2177496.1 class I SAM-dependent methyltransferase [Pseudanabaena sp. FACHB-1998]